MGRGWGWGVGVLVTTIWGLAVLHWHCFHFLNYQNWNRNIYVILEPSETKLGTKIPCLFQSLLQENTVILKAEELIWLKRLYWHADWVSWFPSKNIDFISQSMPTHQNVWLRLPRISLTTSAVVIHSRCGADISQPRTYITFVFQKCFLYSDRRNKINYLYML